MLDLSTAQKFHPILQSRKTELIAWMMFALMILVGLFGTVESGISRSGVIFFTLFLGLSAVLISFGNWVDRKTVMMLDSKGVHFENGLRGVGMTWSAIERVDVRPDRLGKRVHVFGENKYFAFRTLAVLDLGENKGGKMGFEQGEDILKVLVVNAGLTGPAEEPGNSAYYYLRE